MSSSSKRAHKSGNEVWESSSPVPQIPTADQPRQFGYVWRPEHAVKKPPMPVYENGDGIPEMLEEGFRLCPNDKLLRSFARQYAKWGDLTAAQYNNLKRFYDSWGGNTLP